MVAAKNFVSKADNHICRFHAVSRWTGRFYRGHGHCVTSSVEQGWPSP